ncbi:uncharacterized protein LOC128853167 isoform X2 [Cuculus canorus]|uniref:uncharacterized protein LOC128853167 isoform X2 n=1 Tax=Cuculus canorus TaxID=55661 RepID=UPI0023AB4CA4|nr:uncharacterized protein LOC128853167 isoform X2 [Cuculus canorus]
MKVEALMVTVLLLVLLSPAPAPSQALGDRTATPERQPGVGGPEEDLLPPGKGGNNLPRQGSKRSCPMAGEWELKEEAPMGSRSTSRAMAKSPPCSSEQDPASKPPRLLPQPLRSRSPRLSHHLKGYGKFNGDTHSCHSIQSRPCQKPSDCGGCLGLYTCKLPTSKCVLKAVSRQRGRLLQTIQSPVGPKVLLIPEQ